LQRMNPGGSLSWNRAEVLRMNVAGVKDQISPSRRIEAIVPGESTKVSLRKMRRDPGLRWRLEFALQPAHYLICFQGV